MSIHYELLALASAFFGLSVLIALWTILHFARRETGRTTTYNRDETRHENLREISWAFRFGERAVLYLAGWNRRWEQQRLQSRSDATKLTRMETVGQALKLTRPNQFWEPDEYLGLLQFEAILVGLGVGLFFWNIVDQLTGLLFGTVIAWTYYELQVQSIIEEGRRIREQITRRLPFVMDLMSLTIGAGASFVESIQTAANENGKHPVADMLRDALARLSRGRTIQQAMNEMADRVNEETVSELVFTINKAEELGTPTAQTLSELADQMRLKRQQWGEKVAGEAQVKIMFPGILIMIACIIAILSPILLAALSEFSS